MDEGERRLSIDIGAVDLDHGTREALRLLAAPANVEVYLEEAGRVVNELFDAVDIESLDDESASLLLHRIMALVAGFTIVGVGAVSVAADFGEVDRLEILKAIEDAVEDDDEPAG